MYDNARYYPLGDRAVTVEFGNKISPEINERVRAMLLSLENRGYEEIISFVPAYRSLMIEYDPFKVSYNELIGKLKGIEKNISSVKLPPPNVLEVPVLYGQDKGPDIDYVAENAGLTADEVIEIHSEPMYLIYMLGFTPGFPYLGGMNPKIEAPRLEVPRQKIERGSVGIAGMQTGIYSVDSPGGWRLIGKTPIELYNPLREPPIIQRTGDYIKFVPVSKGEYSDIEESVKEGRYQYIYYPLEVK